MTEFGASLHARHGWVGSVVEVTKPAGDGVVIAAIHAGSDLFARQCYAPDMRPRGHPVRAYDAGGVLKGVSGGDGDSGPGARAVSGGVLHDIAGPLCFSGDVVAPSVVLPQALRPGDIVVLEEAGANTLGIFTSHCSRRRPPVWGYSRKGLVAGAPVASEGKNASENSSDGFLFSCLAVGKSYTETLSVWSAPSAATNDV